MSAFSPVQTHRAVPSGLTVSPLAPALGVMLLIVVAQLATVRVDSDVAWQLWVAGRLHAGANLYTDIVEVNPPLWFWMAVPIERLSSLLHLRSGAVLVGAFGLSTGLALIVTDRLIGHIPPSRRALLLAYSAVALGFVPWMHVGQREQIVLIATVPYSALIAARRRAQPVPKLLAALIGIAGGLGFALKHYFLIVPALLELHLLASTRGRWRVLRPEVLALVSTGFIYATVILLFEKDFMTRTVPLVRLAYGAIGANSFGLLLGPCAASGMLVLAVVATQSRRLASSEAPFAAALAVAALAFVFVYFVQAKGWPYHAIPLVGCASTALAAVLAETSPSATLRILAPAVLTLPLVPTVKEQLEPAAPPVDVRTAVAGMQPGDAVAFLTTESAIPWSATLQGGYRYASRYMSFWMMGAIVRNEQSGNEDARVDALGRQIVADTITDFSCTPPRRIIVSRPRPGENAYDILPFFLRNPRFASLLSHYRVRSRTTLEAYEQVSPLPPPTEPCRHGI